MKKILFLAMVGVAAAVMGADNLPDYSKAAAKSAKHVSAADWQQKNAAAIAAATDAAVLAAFVENEASAKSLLDRLEGAYRNDPIVMTQVATVTHWVTSPEPFFLWFWEPSPAAGRKVWVAALEAKAASSPDAYVSTLCRQQLDICR